jgi:hypothetical protein
MDTRLVWQRYQVTLALPEKLRNTGLAMRIYIPI